MTSPPRNVIAGMTVVCLQGVDRQHRYVAHLRDIREASPVGRHPAAETMS
jgi:hypothetical protein